MNYNTLRNSYRVSLYAKRFCSQYKTVPPKGLKEKPEADKIFADYIGPPDKSSNLRPIVRHIPKEETALEEELRLRQIEIENWNQKFWTNHNQRFYEEKSDFVKAHSNGNSNTTISPDKMSEFYKAFLDKNWKIHAYYNLSWYIKNFELLMMTAQVKLQKTFRRLRKR